MSEERTNYRKAKRGEIPCGSCRQLVEPDFPGQAPRCPIQGMYAIGRKNTCDKALRREDRMATAEREQIIEAFYAKELKSDQCQCGRTKKPGRSLCFPCFRDLPVEMQEDLYKKIGSGYEEAYEAAVKWLEES